MPKKIWRAHLELEAREDMLLIVRLATSGIVTRAGIDYEGVEECKSAVNEACFYLISESCAILSVEYQMLADRIRIVVEGSQKKSGNPSGNIEKQVLSEILHELVTNAEISETRVELERMI